MPQDSQLQLRVSRLENDRDSLYDLVTQVRATQDDHTRQLADHSRRLDGIDGRLDGIDARLDRIEAVLAEIVRRLPEPIS